MLAHTYMLGPRVLERWLMSFEDTSQTREIESLLRKLTAPTLIVWGAADPFFPLKWAYWLKGAIPGAREVVELEGAKLFFPEERPDALADAVRAHWRTSADARRSWLSRTPPPRHRASSWTPYGVVPLPSRFVAMGGRAPPRPHPPP